MTLARSTPAVDWTSAETMRRPDELYTWVIDIAHHRYGAFAAPWGLPAAAK